MKPLLQRLFHLLGYEIKKWKKNQPEIDKQKKEEEEDKANFHFQNQWLIDLQFASIIDIGANTGQFAKKMRYLFPDAMIYSFEPIPNVFNKLKENFIDDKKFTALNFGLGDKESLEDFYLNEFSDSSSFLKMSEIHKENFPITANESKTRLEIKRLDDILDVNKISKPYLLKLDVQGFEEKVIKGGKHIIENAEYIITEVSFVELYEKQPLFDTIYSLMKQMGFQYMGNYGQLASYTNKEVMQADAIFKKIK